MEYSTAGHAARKDASQEEGQGLVLVLSILHVGGHSAAERSNLLGAPCCRRGLQRLALGHRRPRCPRHHCLINSFTMISLAADLASSVDGKVESGRESVERRKLSSPLGANKKFWMEQGFPAPRSRI